MIPSQIKPQPQQNPLNPSPLQITTPSNPYIISLLKDPRINIYTSDYIIQMLNKDSLIKIEEFMRGNRMFRISQFIRYFREFVPISKSTDLALTNNETDQLPSNQFFITLALFKLFQQICNTTKSSSVSFSNISTHIAQKMPNFTTQTILKEKLLPPLHLQISQQHKKQIHPPQIYGKISQEYIYLTQIPIKSDKIQHISRDVGQSEYSLKNKQYFTIDKPSTQIKILNNNFHITKSIKTQLTQISKRDMIIICIGWSERQQKIAAVLGNYSISVWSKFDDYKYEVNTPLTAKYLDSPFVAIKYMDSLQKWITLSNHPHIHTLSHSNYEPQSTFFNAKIHKKKAAQKMLIHELHYVQLLCLAFEHNVFLISLKNKQIVSEISNFHTAITSITFSQQYQALFISTYESHFNSYQLTINQDLIKRGKFENHKSTITLLGTIPNKPVVFSVQQSSILKLFDMRDYTCYQSVSLLKNILYKQVICVDEGSGVGSGLCFVGSKMYVYGVHGQDVTGKKKLARGKQIERVVYFGECKKNIVVVTNTCCRIFDISSGTLISVITPQFPTPQTSICSAYVLDVKQKLFLMNAEGECSILETTQYTQISLQKYCPFPQYLHYDITNELLTQVSYGNIRINKVLNPLCETEIRRQIINESDCIRIFKIFEKNDVIVVSYENDDNVYFYAYEKGKILGYLNFGARKLWKWKDIYRGQKIIWRAVDVEFYEDKNIVIILLDDQFMVFTYNRSSSSMSFNLRKSIKLWENPLSTPNLNPTTYSYNIEKQDQPLYSCGFAIFNHSEIIIASNRMNIAAIIKYNIMKMANVNKIYIIKDNYNPNRIGVEEHTGASKIRKPMTIIKEITSIPAQLSYNIYRERLGNFTICSKIGNIFVLSDDQANIVFLQYPNWAQISGIVNCEETLPKFWNIFKYSENEIKQIEFVLSFMENQNKLPQTVVVKGMLDFDVLNKPSKDQFIARLTISQLVKQHKQKVEGKKEFRSNSLRQRKMILQKQRDQKQKMENFIAQQKKIKKERPSNSQKNNAQRQINDTLGYLSINHNENLLKKGILQQQSPSIIALDQKLSASLRKDGRQSVYSLASYASFSQSVKSLKKIQTKSKVPGSPLKDFKEVKTLSSEFYQSLTERLGLNKKYSSKVLIETLNSQKNQSKIARNVDKNLAKFPSLFK